MKKYRPQTDSYVIEVNGLPFEITKEEDLNFYNQLMSERNSNSDSFEVEIFNNEPDTTLPEPTLEERNRADIDYISIMLGVEL